MADSVISTEFFFLRYHDIAKKHVEGNRREIREIRDLLYGWFRDFDRVFNDISIRRGLWVSLLEWNVDLLYEGKSYVSGALYLIVEEIILEE